MPLSNIVPNLLDISERWSGPRKMDGRPAVDDTVLESLRMARTEHIWSALERNGYSRQFEGGWRETNPGHRVVGRAYTCAFLPFRPDLDSSTVRQGERDGFFSAANQNGWVVDSLERNDILVADIFGKVVEGTVLGDNLGTAVAARTGVGAIINGGIRDFDGLSELNSVNIYFRDMDPTPIGGVTLSGVNVPVRLGGATVVPGDVVVGGSSGVICIPAHLAEDVSKACADVAQRDVFAKECLAEGRFPSDAIDVEIWGEDVETAYQRWLAASQKSGSAR